MQIILQATHGIVSGSPMFFKRAFGDTVGGFERLLSRPERFIFNRVWYEELGGEAEFTEYQLLFSRLSNDERAELISLLSTSTPSKFLELRTQATNRNVREILEFYRPLTDPEEAEIWRQCREQRSTLSTQAVEVPDDERVEDAGLAEAA
jgi:hypothetical protein